MADNQKIKPPPAVFGVAISVLLLASRYFGASSGAGLESLNTVIVIAALCLCLHLVRRTSALFQPHVWSTPATVVLFALPMATLIVTGLQLIFAKAPSFLSSKPFLTVLIFASAPVFLCAYFVYISKKLQSRQLRAFSLVLAGVGTLYTLLRLLNAILFPLIEELAGRQINPAIITVAAWNTHLSFLIYLMTFGGFFLLHTEIKTLNARAE